MKRLVVIALGGNSLIKDNDKISAEDQLEVIQASCKPIVNLVKNGFDVVITHGNGPQVGFNLLKSEAAREQVPPQPLDVAVAETQGSIGYMIQQAMKNEYSRQNIDKDVVTVVTQVKVSADDTAFQKPQKPIGPFYDREQAEELKREKGWDLVEDAGRGYRRVVASPRPVEIVELRAIRALVEKGFTVISCGGGGIPVISDRDSVAGSAAVIDKDRVASLIGGLLNADLLVIPTGVSKVALNFGKPNQIDLDSISLEDAQLYMEQGHFAAGSMGPKIEAAVSFLEAGGAEAIITLPEMIEQAVLGDEGTHIYAQSDDKKSSTVGQ
ncbi:MAG TPA: carbamate kinase [Syntrophomonadaceae bacterium]|nr:carbamate kinase [Syntrophomonadaceae bacterium]